MIFTEEKHLHIIKEILSKYPYTFYVFGSRARGNPKKFSDLDLCFVEPIPLNVRAHMDQDFEESDLPYTVDIVDWNTCSGEFKNAIYKDLVIVQGTKKILK